MSLRKTREEEALRALSTAQRAYQQELHNKADILEKLDGSLNRRQGLADKSRLSNTFVGAFDYQLEQNFIVGLKQNIIRADQQITRASRAVQKALYV